MKKILLPLMALIMLLSSNLAFAKSENVKQTNIEKIHEKYQKELQKEQDKQAKKDAKKLKKENKKAEKQAKKDEIKLQKEQKAQIKEEIKQAKKDAAEEKKQNKLQAKQDKKAAKLQEKEDKKQAKLQKKEEERQAKLQKKETKPTVNEEKTEVANTPKEEAKTAEPSEILTKMSKEDTKEDNIVSVSNKEEETPNKTEIKPTANEEKKENTEEQKPSDKEENKINTNPALYRQNLTFEDIEKNDVSINEFLNFTTKQNEKFNIFYYKTTNTLSSYQKQIQAVEAQMLEVKKSDMGIKSQYDKLKKLDKTHDMLLLKRDIYYNSALEKFNSMLNKKQKIKWELLQQMGYRFLPVYE